MAQPKIKAIFNENKISVVSTSEEDLEGFSSRGYGTPEDDGVVFTFFEALYLLEKGVIDIEDESTKEELLFDDVLHRFQSVDKNAWVRYLIYRDLRSRGYVVREGFGLGIDFRVYERGEYGKDTATYLIFGIQEGQPVSMEELAQALRYTQSLKKKLVLAVINRRGEVVYYSLSSLVF